MRAWSNPSSEPIQNTIAAHNWLVGHAHIEGLGILGRYYVIRMLHHMHGYHRTFKIIDFFYALRWM